MSKSKILFLMTGSIACYKACQLVSRLVQEGHEVQVVASPSALQFVGNATLEGLTGKTVISDMYSRGNVMDHIHLVRWADLIIVAPTTANYINKIAHGIGDDLLTTLFLSHDFKKPFLIAPAMNSSMYEHPATHASLKRLREFGVIILDTDSGALACGEVGAGRLMDPEKIHAAIQMHLGASPNTSAFPTKRSAHSFSVLITAGGTIEPIDKVRVVTNLSRGDTGRYLADFLSDLGATVHLLRAETASMAELEVRQSTFSTFSDLQAKLFHLLETQEFDMIIHAAAVSDFSVAEIEVGGARVQPGQMAKIPSMEQFSIHFKRNPKLVDQIKSKSLNKAIKLIAFKLTSEASSTEQFAAVEKLKCQSKADMIIHNDTTEIDKTANTHRFTLYHGDEKIPLGNIENLAFEIAKSYLKENL